MSSLLPNKNELREQAVEGRPITQTEASTIASADKNFVAKAGDVARKPANEITKEDAAQVQSAEARVLGGRPSKGSTSADVQSLADENAKVQEQ
ncbi:seed maturation protein [Colletotrichum plurivorum]|uniref:Seed maturation protein n=1 Tax=Colletotrichum plurivorum TaxID=2175906 RepID=A0A8H6KW50_9PEZI|nr:seed maturation protein [Colletotrichum plurivorum]